MGTPGERATWGLNPPPDANWPNELRKARTHTSDPQLPLSAREQQAAVLYVTGSGIDAIGVAMGLSVTTVKAYLEQARTKYTNAGQNVDELEQLRACLVDEGYLDN